MTTVDEENYRVRLEFHQTCQEPDAESLARADASVLHILALEEYDDRLLAIWNDINGRLRAVMEELKAERADSANNVG